MIIEKKNDVNNDNNNNNLLLCNKLITSNFFVFPLKIKMFFSQGNMEHNHKLFTIIVKSRCRQLKVEDQDIFFYKLMEYQLFRLDFCISKFQ